MTEAEPEPDDVRSVAVLNYRNPRERTGVRRARDVEEFRFAVGCGAVPLGLSLTDLAGYLVTRSDVFRALGALVPGFDVIASTMGGVTAVAFVAARWGRAEDRWRDCLVPGGLLLLLLASNGPAAVAYLFVAGM